MEISFLEWLQTLHTPVLDRVMVFITSLANAGALWIALSVILLAFKRTRRIGLAVGLALLMGAIGVNLIVKPLVNRVRPYDAVGFTQLLISRQADASFPSGHTQASFASALVLWHFNKKAGAAALVLAALIAFSRLYLFVHYPTDVAAGILFGALWAVLAVKLLDFLEQRHKSRQRLEQ